MEKKFKKMDDHLEVIIIDEQPIRIPAGDETVDVGHLDMTQIQKIDLDKVPVVVKFVQDQIDSADKQMEAMDKQLETIGEVESIDDKVVEACKKAIDNGSNGFKTKMRALNKNIENIMKRKQLNTQKEYLQTQTKPMREELAKIEAAMA